MTKETLNKAKEIDLEMTATRLLLVRLLKAKEVSLSLEYWDDGTINSYSEDVFVAKNWLVEAMRHAIEEHRDKLQQELDAL